MITYTKGNLLDAPVEALVNTVNTVGVMGKGIALMFKERFPKNMSEYAKACKEDRVQTGIMFVTKTDELMGPRWIINFPTKQHWKGKSKIEWIESGLKDLRKFLIENDIRSIAIPPLGSGNGGLEWQTVKLKIEKELSDLNDVEILIYEPTSEYQNVTKKVGVKELTPARALIAEFIRRYWILGMECSLLEIQKLAWFLQRVIDREAIKNELNFKFEAKYYGPYADNLKHLLNALDGSYLQSDKRIPDCEPLDVIWFNEQERDKVSVYLKSEAKFYLPALDKATEVINGFESPYGMELLSTVDWLIFEEKCNPDLASIKAGIRNWPAGSHWAERKANLFDDSSLQLAINRLKLLSA